VNILNSYAALSASSGHSSLTIPALPNSSQIQAKLNKSKLLYFAMADYFSAGKADRLRVVLHQQ
jgi:hypothetical protein